MTTNDLFIAPGVTINQFHPNILEYAHASKSALRARWNSPHGQNILAEWHKSGYDSDQLTKLIGKLYDHYDLRGIPLQNAQLAKKYLTAIDFYAANLENADLRQADVSFSHFSEANINGANFSFAKVREAFFDNAEFDHRTNFIGVEINTFRSYDTALLYEFAHTQQKIQNLEKMYPYFSQFLKYSCDYGRSLGRFSGWIIFVIVSFASIFYGYSGLLSQPVSFIDAVYFSMITFSTLGYGDIIPVTIFAKFLVIIEVALGYLMGGLLVAILTKRVFG